MRGHHRADPHLLGVQEAYDWAKAEGRLLNEVEERVGLTSVTDSFLPGQSTGLLYDPTVMGLVEWEPTPKTRSGFTGTALFDVGRPFFLSVIVVHLSHQSSPLALHQASLVNERARRVADRRQPPDVVRAEAGLVFGDVNQPDLRHPQAPPEPQPSDLPAANLAYHFKGRPGEETVNRDVAELFARCRWHTWPTPWPNTDPLRIRPGYWLPRAFMGVSLSTGFWSPNRWYPR